MSINTRIEGIDRKPLTFGVWIQDLDEDTMTQLGPLPLADEGSQGIDRKPSWDQVTDDMIPT